MLRLTWYWRAHVLLPVLVLLVLAACKHGKCEGGGYSAEGDNESHNAGADCFSCHYPDGEGEGCWTIGGTVYDSSGTQPSMAARFRLFTEPQGQGSVVLQLHSDALGNIYTSDDVLFGNGLYPAVINANGDTAFMNGRVFDGACNRCHGSSTGRIVLP